MSGSVLFAPEAVEVREIPTPTLQPGDVLLRVAAVGLCGSDLSAWRGKHPFRKPPVILGHEVAGTITAVGSDVDSNRIGERVAVEPHRLCGTCAHCRAGRNQLCGNKILPGTDGWIGGLVDTFVAPSAMAHPIPDDLPLELAALAEPLAVAMHAVRRAQVTDGDRVNVIGAGTIGLLVCAAARSLGATVDVVTDLDDERLAHATRLGAARPTNVDGVDLPGAVAADPTMAADVTVIAATAPRSLVEASALTVAGGTMVLLGLYPGEAPIDAVQLVLREQSLLASVTYNSRDFRDAIASLAASQDVFEPFITARIGLSDVGDELVGQAARSHFSLKTLVIPTMKKDSNT